MPWKGGSAPAPAAPPPSDHLTQRWEHTFPSVCAYVAGKVRRAKEGDVATLNLVRDAVQLLLDGFEVDWLRDEMGVLVGVQARLRSTTVTRPSEPVVDGHVGVGVARDREARV